LLSHFQSNVEPEVEFTDVRLMLIAADMVLDSTHTVLQVEDLSMKGLEVRSSGIVLNVVPLAHEGTQVTLPSVRCHNGRSHDVRFQNLLERLTRGVLITVAQHHISFAFLIVMSL